jgi:hypothetical protein
MTQPPRSTLSSLLCIILGVACAFIVKRAETAGDKTAPPSNVAALMREVRDEITALEPYIVSESKFMAPASEPVISAHLDRLNQLSEQVIRRKELQGASFRLSGEALHRHLQTARSVFKSGQRGYARWMLAATPQACASCHTQRPQSPATLWAAVPQDFSGTPFERAEFLFATRNYGAALEAYSAVLRTPKPDVRELERALKRKLVLFIRVQRDPVAAAASLSEDLQATQWPPHIKAYVNTWIPELRRLGAHGLLDGTHADAQTVLRYAQRWIGENPHVTLAPENPRLIRILDASAALYQFLDTHPVSDDTPELLRWLAACDHGLNNEFFFSLGNMYLVECMRRFPASAAARRCYADYEEEIKFLYTGSRGTEVAPEAAAELSELKRLVEKRK